MPRILPILLCAALTTACANSPAPVAVCGGRAVGLSARGACAQTPRAWPTDRALIEAALAEHLPAEPEGLLVLHHRAARGVDGGATVCGRFATDALPGAPVASFIGVFPTREVGPRAFRPGLIGRDPQSAARVARLCALSGLDGV